MLCLLGPYNMSLLVIDHHNTVGLRLVYVYHKIVNGVIGFLNINVGKTNRAKILYFVVGILHTLESTTWGIIEKVYMRVELESKALPFQGKESGAVPTNTHHKELSHG